MTWGTLLKALIGAILVAFSTVSPVSAGGPRGHTSLKDEPYPTFSWTGMYVGLTAGYGWGDSRFDDGARSNPFDIDGFVAGGTLGYNLQMHGNLVVGIEADLSYSGISGSFGPGNLGQPGGGGWGCGSGPCETDVNWFGTVRGRVGLAFDRMMVFATGGVAFGDIDSQIRNAADFRTGNTAVGWAAGGGIEFALRPGWTAKLEYLHVDLGWTDRTDPNDFRADAVFDVVRVGLNYQLGR